MNELFPLAGDLPENWTIDQTIAPEGLIAGLDERHGYNYLMRAVNEAHRACNLLKEECGSLREELAKKANVGPPSIFDIEFAEGYSAAPSHTSIYSKTSENLVIINISAVTDNDGFKEGQHIIAAIPEGFRPDKLVVVGGGVSNPDGGRIRYMAIYPDGRIFCRVEGGRVGVVHAAITFFVSA